LKRTNKITLSHAANPLIDFVGTEASDTSKNISTRIGVGNKSTPHKKNTINGFFFYTMIKVSLSGINYWLPAYREDIV